MYVWIGDRAREEGPILFVPCTKCVGANNRSGFLRSREPVGSKTSLAKQGDWDLTVPFPALKKTLQSVFFYAKNSPGGIISEKGSHLREKPAILRHFSRKKISLSSTTPTKQAHQTPKFRPNGRDSAPFGSWTGYFFNYPTPTPSILRPTSLIYS